MTYDLIVVGTGFASSFFLHRYLQHRRPRHVLVLEAGPRVTHTEQLAAMDPTNRAVATAAYDQVAEQKKSWMFTLAFGGGSNCWWACTPRMLPEDFELHRRYGVGSDWPISYDDLEPYYCDAEDILAVSGPSDDTPFRRSRRYPQPPHRFTHVDRALKAAHPESFFHQPTARARLATERRPGCCANGVCTLCPIDAKFTIRKELPDLYARPEITVMTGARVQSVDVQGGVAKGVRWLSEGTEHHALGELVVLGANALFNAHILLRSGIDHPELGRGVVEQSSVTATVYLDGLDNFQGSTSLTGHGYTAYAGPHRAERAAALVETSNVPLLRTEPGRWRQVAYIKFIYEDLRRPENRIELQDEHPDRPRLHWEARSDYAQRGLDAAPADLDNLCSSLPIERVAWSSPADTEAHILGSHVMGDDRASSVVDAEGRVHGVSNLVALGGGSFPTAAPANPTLTICALALRSADRLGGSA